MPWSVSNILQVMSVIDLVLATHNVAPAIAYYTMATRVEENWQAARWGADPDEEHVANARRLDLVAVGDLVGALAERN